MTIWPLWRRGEIFSVYIGAAVGELGGGGLGAALAVYKFVGKKLFIFGDIWVVIIKHKARPNKRFVQCFYAACEMLADPFGLGSVLFVGGGLLDCANFLRNENKRVGKRHGTHRVFRSACHVLDYDWICWLGIRWLEYRDMEAFVILVFYDYIIHAHILACPSGACQYRWGVIYNGVQLSRNNAAAGRDADKEFAASVPVDSSDLVVFTAVKRLATYVILVTERSPKHFRGVFVNKMQGYCIECLELLYKANLVFIADEATFTMRQGLQMDAIARLKLLGYLSTIAEGVGCILAKQLKHISELLADAINLISAWRKSDTGKWRPANC